MADLSLYNLSNEYEYLYDLIDRDVLTDEENENIRKNLAEKMEENAEDILKFYLNKEALKEMRNKEIERLKRLNSKDDKVLDTIKKNLTINMRKMNIPNIQTNIGKMLVKNSTTYSVEIIDEEKVPDKYKSVETTTKFDKNAIKKDYKANKTPISGIKIIESQPNVEFHLK